MSLLELHMLLLEIRLRFPMLKDVCLGVLKHSRPYTVENQAGRCDLLFESVFYER